MANINGTPNNDTLRGTDGNDVISGLNGNDTIIGSKGNDTLNGGSGFDTANYSNLGRAITILPRGVISKGSFGTDTISGINNIVGATGKANKIDGSSSTGGASLIVDLAQGDSLRVNLPGRDPLQFSIINFVDVTGTPENDIITGNSENNVLIGGNGNDRLTGVNTGLGAGKGDIDTLTGGQGNDIFVLGAQINGSDVVFYNDGDRSTAGTGDYALITDFGFAGDDLPRGSDKIQLAGSSNSYSLGSSPSGLPSGTGIFFENGTLELIGILQGISRSDISLSNSNQFIFV